MKARHLLSIVLACGCSSEPRLDVQMQFVECMDVSADQLYVEAMATVKNEGPGTASGPAPFMFWTGLVVTDVDGTVVHRRPIPAGTTSNDVPSPPWSLKVGETMVTPEATIWNAEGCDVGAAPPCNAVPNGTYYMVLVTPDGTKSNAVEINIPSCTQ